VLCASCKFSPHHSSADVTLPCLLHLPCLQCLTTARALRCIYSRFQGNCQLPFVKVDKSECFAVAALSLELHLPCLLPVPAAHMQLLALSFPS
jgi:hypothetical protein